jgi:hypothetical protein
LPEVGLEDHVNDHHGQNDRYESFEQRRINLQNGPGAQASSCESIKTNPTAIFEVNLPGTCIMNRGTRGAAGRLQFVRAKQVPGVAAEAEQHRECDEPPATSDRIHKAGEDPGHEEQRELPGRIHDQGS